MKRLGIVSVCLCLALCGCGAGDLAGVSYEPETSDGGSAVSVPVSKPLMDAEQVLLSARALFADLLDGKLAGTGEPWVTADNAGAIRETVAQLNEPFLTVSDVLAAQDVIVRNVLSGELTGTLPPCGAMAETVLPPSDSPEAAGRNSLALLSCTLCLFTPPDGVIREENDDPLSDVIYRFWFSLTGGDSAELTFDRLETGKHPLDVRGCISATLRAGDEVRDVSAALDRPCAGGGGGDGFLSGTGGPACGGNWSDRVALSRLRRGRRNCTSAPTRSNPLIRSCFCGSSRECLRRACRLRRCTA